MKKKEGEVFVFFFIVDGSFGPEGKFFVRLVN